MTSGDSAAGSTSPGATPAVDARRQQAGPIVVGMDGSPGSLAALGWAVREARLRGSSIRAVMAWQQPLAYGGANSWALGMDPAVDTEYDLSAAVDAEIARLGEDFGPQDDVDIVYEALEGHPAEALIAAADDPDALLVVGSRGHGGFVGALLGSVSQHVVSHAHCPVVVVRAPEKSPKNTAS